MVAVLSNRLGSSDHAEEHPGSPAGRRTARGRPRSEASRRAVLDSAYTILVGEGLAGFSVEAVALHSGVARTTIYRWWPTRGMLAMESFREAFETQLDFSASASPDADVRDLIASLACALGGPAGRLAASIMAEAQSDLAVRTRFFEDFSMPLRERSTAVFRAGVDAGAFASDLDIPRMLDALVGAVYLRLMFGLPLDSEWSAAMSETLLRGCLAR